MSNATETTAPEFIAADTYTGRWITYSRNADKLGNRTAGWLADHIGDGNTAVIWEFFGKNNAGQMMFHRTRFVSAGGQLHGYDSDGCAVIIHPADRNVRFFSA